MLSLRDVLASALLGVQMTSADSSNDSASGAKKNKKKPHKKKAKKSSKVEKKVDIGAGRESADTESEDSDDDADAVDIGHFGASEAQSHEAKAISALVYQFESTQIEDPLQIMIRKLATECAVSVQHASETVNRMFECGLQYDDYEAVKKELLPKALSRTIDVREEPGSQYASAMSSPVPGQATESAAVRSAAAALPQPAAAHSKAPSVASVAPVVATMSNAHARSAAVDADAAAALAKLTGVAHQPAPPTQSTHTSAHAPRGKHVREIESAQPAALLPAPVVAATTSEPALTSMKEKLDFVAGFSRTSLYDSLAALCSWAAVSLPASPQAGSGEKGSGPSSAQKERQQKMEAFFQSQALEILLSTLFSDESQQLSSRPDVNSAFQALLQHILLLNGADAQGSATVHHVTEALGALIAQISALRSAAVLPAFAAPASHGHGLLASQVAACIKRLYFQLSFASTSANNALSGADDATATGQDSSNEDLFARLADIDAQLSKLDKSSGAKKASAPAEIALEKAQNLFQGREMHADKMSTCLESVKALAAQAAAASTKPSSSQRAAAAATHAAATHTSTAAELHRSITESSADIERALLNECNMLINQPNSPVGVSRIAPGDAHSLQSKHQQNHHITSHYERLSYERDAKLSLLSNEIAANNMRTQEVSAHKKRLLEQVALCDQELVSLNGRGNALAADLNSNTFYYQQQLDQLAHTGNSVRKSLQAHDQVNNLLGAVRAFETKFADALLHQHSVATTALHASPAGGAQAGRTTVLTSSTMGHASSTATAAATGAEEHRALLSERLLLLSGTTRGYVAAEGQCLRFLSERVEAAKSKMAACRKELLAYTALSMKGSVVQTAEASAAQLDAEIREDQQAARQLLQNVSDFVAQIKLLQSALNPPAVKGKAPGSARKGAAVESAGAQYTIDLPGSEFARIVSYCAAMDVSPPVELVLLAGTASVPPSPARAQAPAVTAAPAPVAPVVHADETASAAAPVSALGSAPAASRKGVPETGARSAQTNTRDRVATRGPAGRDSKPAGGDRDGRKRSAPAPAAPTVDTTSAISLLEKSCLQKPSTGNAPKPAPTAAASKTADQAAPKPVKVAMPVNSAWKVPAASASAGVQESKASEEVKSLKEIQAEQLVEKAQLAAARQAKKESLTLAPKNAAVQADAAAHTVETAAPVAVAPVPVEILPQPRGGALEETPSSSDVLGTVPPPSSGTDALAPVSVSTPQDSANTGTPVGAKKPRNRKKKGDSTHAEEEEEVAPISGATFDGTVTDVPTDSPSKAAPESRAEAEATVARTPSPAKKKNGRKDKATPEETPVKAAVEAAAEELPTPQAAEAELHTPSPAKKSKAKGKGKVPVEASSKLTVLETAEKDEASGADEAAACALATASSQEGEGGALTVAVDALSPVPASSRVAASAQGTLTVVADSPAAGGDQSNPLSPLVEFHSLYPSLEDKIPAHDSVEEAEYHNSTPVASLVDASPLVEYHNTYPDLQARTFREEMEEIEESSDEEEEEDSAQLGYDLKNTTMDSTISAMSNQSASSLSRVRDLNPLTRPSPGRNSFRMRLDMSTAVETEVAATEAEARVVVPVVQEIAVVASEEAVDAADEDEQAELPENALDMRDAAAAGADVTAEEGEGEASGPVMMTPEVTEDADRTV